MISQSKNRVQAIKNKFENLNIEAEPLIIKKHSNAGQLFKQQQPVTRQCDKENSENSINYTGSKTDNNIKSFSESEASDETSLKPNVSYLHNKNDVKRTLSDSKKVLSRQSSDPGKKLHRSHAFRCDRSQKISPKRHGSCNGRSETGGFLLKGERKLSKERLKKLGNLLEDQMRKENFSIDNVEDKKTVSVDSVPDSNVPQHILDQYAKVLKPKKVENESKQDLMTDSGVSSETENLEDEKINKLQKINIENCNLTLMDDLCTSSETIKLERKNPHLVLTDTLKKALKQPLPQGPPPKKPPRSCISPIFESESPEKKKKDTKQMLEKLEQVLQKREARTQVQNEYDVAESNLSVQKPKEVHYLCTEILDITNRTLLPNQTASNPLTSCLNSLNCAIVTNSMTSLPYIRMSSEFNTNRCSCSSDNLNIRPRLSTFLDQNKCGKCMVNDEKEDGFKCHLNCKCGSQNSAFYVEKEHIYDVPSTEEKQGMTSSYGTLNMPVVGTHRSLEDLRKDEEKIYDIPCDVSRPETPENQSSPELDPLTPVTTAVSKIEVGSQQQLLESTQRSKIDKERWNYLPELIQSTKKEIEGLRHISEQKQNSKTEFEKLRQNFEIDSKKIMNDKPALSKKPSMPNVCIPTENIANENTRTFEKKFATEGKRHRKFDRKESDNGLSTYKNKQLDMDRENLNRLMNEIYATVSAACNMDDSKPGSFPTENTDGSTGEDSVKLTRSLTEKRKNYVRRVSSKVAYLDSKNIKNKRTRHQTSVCSYKSEIIDNPYSTFRSWKSFRASQNNINMADKLETSGSTSMDSDASIDNLSIDEKTGCVDIDLPFEPREKGLFNVCLLVGLNYMSGQAYVKSVFPSQVKVPPHIENLIFPETISSISKGQWSAEAQYTQCYSLVLTDERGERSYGYCRRVLPEGATTCLPLCYCLIGKYRAPGYYYKILQEIESHHGSPDVEIHSILQQLLETDFPSPGEEVTITYTTKTHEINRNSVNFDDLSKNMVLSLDNVSDIKNEVLNRTLVNVTRSAAVKFNGSSGTMADVSRSKTMPTRRSTEADNAAENCDMDNNKSAKKVVLNFDGVRTRTVKRPIEPRVDEDNLSILLDTLGPGLVIKVFGSLLLERKVIIVGDQLSTVSSCLEALQSSLYPFVWQQPLISSVPQEIQRDVLEAPLPILCGALQTPSHTGVTCEEGMLVDLSSPTKVVCCQGDESTILPNSCYKTLKNSLQMESNKHKDKTEDKKTRNVMISEAFLRFFVDVLHEYWRFFSVKDMQQGDFGRGDVVFDKEAFVKNAQNKQNQYFLEWFTETAMFNHFIQNMAVCFARQPSTSVLQSNTSTPLNSLVSLNLELVDTPLPNFYELFEDRVRSRFQSHGADYKNYKYVVNKRVKMLKTKLKELVA